MLLGQSGHPLLERLGVVAQRAHRATCLVEALADELTGALELLADLGLVPGSASTTVANASSWSDSAASVWARTSCSSRARWLRSPSNSARVRSTSARSDASSSLVICSACSMAWRRVSPTMTPVNTAASPPDTTAKLLPLASVATRTASTPAPPTAAAGTMRPPRGGGERRHAGEHQGDRREGGQRPARRRHHDEAGRDGGLGARVAHEHPGHPGEGRDHQEHARRRASVRSSPRPESR